MYLVYNTSNDNYSHNDSYVVIITIYYFKNYEIYCVCSIVEYIIHKCTCIYFKFRNKIIYICIIYSGVVNLY